MAPVIETDIALRDGSTVHVRPSTTDDVSRLHVFLASLSEVSRWFRYFSAGVNLDAAARSAAAPQDGLALIALREGTVVAHATYFRETPDRAEVAFAVADAWHGHGLATVLLAHLAHAASDHGIGTFTATVLSENHRMLGVFHDSGFAVAAHRSEGEVHLEFPTSLSLGARRRFEARQRDAGVAAVSHVLRPASVAVIGTSDRPGAEVVRNLRAGGFTRPLHLVDEAGALAAVDGDVELAVLAVPAAAVVDAARACAAKGVRALVVLTPGFTEVDDLLAVCRAAGMRMLGPNCLGVANPRPEIALNATVASTAPAPGHVGFASQSSGLALAALDAAATRGIGFSSFVSMGDKADLSGNDFLEYWEQDAGTSVLLLHLESFGNPRRFGRIARRITTTKPIVVVKGGRTADAAVDALFAHAGVLRAETMGEMFDVAQLLAHQPLPTGDRVAVLTNARGPGVLCADACEAGGLRPHLVVTAASDDYERSLRGLLGEREHDAVVAIFVPPLGGRVAEVARGITAAAVGADRPVLGVWMGTAAGAVPRFSTPEEAARALVHAVRHTRRRAAPPDPPSEPAGVDSATAATIVAEGLGRAGPWLPPADVERLLRCWGIPVVASRHVASAAAAARAAAELGGAVALKAVVPGAGHKSDAGGVRLNLAGPTAVRRAAREIARRLEDAGTPTEGFEVQRMAPAGTELIVGASADPAFGPLVTCGAGGPAGELLGDVQTRLAPLGPRDADAMLRDLRTFPLLDGYRGRPPAELDSLRDLVMRVAALVATHPAVAELDLDPVIASPGGALVVDARVRLEAPGSAVPFPSLNV
jgi:acyl-CoA synthetase (NDP forming)/RimJ/RimL family protein N-acetyltransferase